MFTSILLNTLATSTQETLTTLGQWQDANSDRAIKYVSVASYLTGYGTWVIYSAIRLALLTLILTNINAQGLEFSDMVTETMKNAAIQKTAEIQQKLTLVYNLYKKNMGYTKTKLYKSAQTLRIVGRSKMNKAQLALMLAQIDMYDLKYSV